MPQLQAGVLMKSADIQCVCGPVKNLMVSLNQQPRDWSRNMRSYAALATLLVLLAPASHARDKCRDMECEKVRQKISKIESKMRQGYSRAQGEKMAAELRRLRALRSKSCR
jgi:hypothetical protein